MNHHREETCESVSVVTLPDATFLPPEHKNADFVLEKAENVGFEWQKRTKTSILCLKGPKIGVPKAKSAQKPRFCAREEVSVWV